MDGFVYRQVTGRFRAARLVQRGLDGLVLLRSYLQRAGGPDIGAGPAADFGPYGKAIRPPLQKRQSDKVSRKALEIRRLAKRPRRFESPNGGGKLAVSGIRGRDCARLNAIESYGAKTAKAVSPHGTRDLRSFG